MISIPPVTHIDACLHLALAVVSPFQSFMDKPGITHEFCNYQALACERSSKMYQNWPENVPLFLQR